MSYKGRIVRNQKQATQILTGTFGVQGRVPAKIAKAQQDVVRNLPAFFKTKAFRADINLGMLHKNADFVELLEASLSLNAKQRASPDMLLTARFLKC